VVIAGTSSGVGKTTITVAVMDALRRKGFSVQGFKVGPDFIDPTYHTMATKRPSRNLDVWMMGEQGVRESFVNACEGADLAVVEGVMGLYDGLSGKDNFSSTAHVAHILRAPVILVLDASKAARSVAAGILGFMHFDTSIRIVGVIFNNVASDRHASYLIDAVNSKIRCPILGVIRRDKKPGFEERHLGLIPTLELRKEKQRGIISAARQAAEQLDIEAILGLFGKRPLNRGQRTSKRKKPVVKLAVALDESFNFYYRDNLDALRNAGAKLEFFSPVNEPRLPAHIDGLLLGGGFPEVLAEELEKNISMKKSIRQAADDGVPIYAECGGLMYLTKSISGYRGSRKSQKMLGLIDAETKMTGRLTLNYVDASCDGPLLGKASLRGHEFHYSELNDIASDTRYAYRLSRGNGIIEGKDGIVFKENCLAAYTHLHFGGNHVATSIVNACIANSRS
jgi:cobyrinic acid a,c-diamide synthase